MQTYRSSILPFAALILTLLGLSYSACHESKAEGQSGSGAAELKQEILRFEETLSELKLIHQGHVTTYSGEMGCTGDSKALEIINMHNELIDHAQARLEYHKLQLIQADTTNQERNNAELAELKKDLEQLESDGQQIRTGFDNFTPATHVTK